MSERLNCMSIGKCNVLLSKIKREIVLNSTDTWTLQEFFKRERQRLQFIICSMCPIFAHNQQNFPTRVGGPTPGNSTPISNIFPPSHTFNNCVRNSVLNFSPDLACANKFPLFPFYCISLVYITNACVPLPT